MKNIGLILLLTFSSYYSFSQDCRLYYVEIIYKGTIQSDLIKKVEIKVPQFDFIQGYNNKYFEKGNIPHPLSNNDFEIIIKDNRYDFHQFNYSRNFLPIIITFIDLDGKKKTQEMKIPREKIDFEFSREGMDVRIIFNLGKIKIE